MPEPGQGEGRRTYAIIVRRGEYSEEEYQADFRLRLEDIENKFPGFDGLTQAYDEEQTIVRKVAA